MMQYSTEFIKYLEAAITQHQFEQIIHDFMALNLGDQANLLQQLSLNSQAALIEHLPQAARVFEFLSLAAQLNIAKLVPKRVLVSLIEAMHSDDSTDLIKLLDPALQHYVFAHLTLQKQAQVRTLAAYAEESAGAIMSSDFVTVSPDWSMQQVLEHLRETVTERETIYSIYITDSLQKLVGIISLREIILAEPDTQVAALMTTDLVLGHADEDQESIVTKLSYYDLMALPIIDQQGHLLGIVTYDDAMDIAQQEATEDFLKSGAIESSPNLSIKTAPILSLYRKRVFWLIILVFGSLLSGIGIAHFEDIIAANIVLVFFLPLLVGSGGNAGSQSATLMVRALATGDVYVKDWFYLIGRESLVACCLGASMAFAVAILGYIRGDSMIALVLALSMMGIVLLGCLIGMSLPFILNRFKLDPASASAPLVTSICDATGVIVYLFIASLLLTNVSA